MVNTIGFVNRLKDMASDPESLHNSVRCNVEEALMLSTYDEVVGASVNFDVLEVLGIELIGWEYPIDNEITSSTLHLIAG
ncbi:MAG: hypothetical protein CME61_00410 [Halobacteriovoraceae bacterium]|nr:hypothetical protein [Halobacteriovoraceae bacterium]